MPLWLPESEWTPPRSLPENIKDTEISIDFETNDPRLGEYGSGWPIGQAEAVGIGVAWGERNKIYVPVRHRGGGNFQGGEEAVRHWAKDLVANCKKLICHNALYDCGILRLWGIDIPDKCVDTMFLAALLDESRKSYRLEDLGKDYLGRGKDEALLGEISLALKKNKKSDLYLFHSKYVGPYGEEDPRVTLDLWKVLDRLIIDEDLTGIAEIENGIIPQLVYMRERGIRVDLDRADQLRTLFQEKERIAIQEIKAKLGWELNPYAAADLEKAFKQEGLSYGYTEAGNPSFDKEFLESISDTHWLPDLVVEAKHAQKMHNTFIESYIFANEHHGRIHGEMVPLKRSKDQKGNRKAATSGTVTGRFSMANPNCMNLPAIGTEAGDLIRSIFLPEEGTLWTGIDFSQQEIRILVDFSYKCSLPGATSAREYFISQGRKADYHAFVSAITGLDRKDAKRVTFGIMYGSGVKKVASEAGISVEEAKRVLEQYHSKLPYAKGLAELTAERASSRQYIRTVGGRKVRFNMWELAGWGSKEKAVYGKHKAKQKWPGQKIQVAFAYKAISSLIQGSAADWIKKSHYDLWKEKRYLPLLSIHDEIAISASCPRDAEEVSEIMLNAFPTDVPMLTDIEYGKNWGEAKHKTPELALFSDFLGKAIRGHYNGRMG